MTQMIRQVIGAFVLGAFLGTALYLAALRLDEWADSYAAYTIPPHGCPLAILSRWTRDYQERC